MKIKDNPRLFLSLGLSFIKFSKKEFFGMAYFRLVTFGKGKISEKNIFHSHHHYDWIKITPFLNLSSNTTVENCLSTAYAECNLQRKNYMEQNASNDNSPRILQNMILLTDLNDTQNVNLSSTSLIYISMINLISENSTEDIYNSIKQYIEEFPSNQELSLSSGFFSACTHLYHTLDHCDFVLICDGEKTTLSDYINFLRNLRTLPFIHDITTEYAYTSPIVNKENLIIHVSSNDKNNISNISHPIKSYDTLGYYDHINIYSTTWNDFENQISFFYDTHMKAHIGTISTLPLQQPCSNDHAPTNKTANNINSELQKNAIELWNQSETIRQIVYSLSKDEDIGQFMFYALNEVHTSILSLLKHGYSQYYVLCFYESFYCIVRYIAEKFISQMDVNNTQEKKSQREQLYELYNEYFRILQTLRVSMIHSEQRFTQADPHPMTYFDIPPKLIAYYTALANQMSSALVDKSSQNKYAFIITPDFKKNIYVDNLTFNRELERELNILSIHISEKNIYHVSQTSYTIAHEVAHHAGLNSSIRILRYPYLIKCLLACNLSDTEHIPQPWTTSSGENSNTSSTLLCDFTNNDLDTFESIVEALYATYTYFFDPDSFYTSEILKNFLENWCSLLTPQLDVTAIQNTMIQEFHNNLWKNLSSNPKIQYKQFLNKYQPYFIELNDNVTNFPLIKKIATGYLSTELWNELQLNIKPLQLNSDTSYLNNWGEIKYTFSEGYSDLCALFLTGFSLEDDSVNLNKKIIEYINQTCQEIGFQITQTQLSDDFITVLSQYAANNIEISDMIRISAVLNYIGTNSNITKTFDSIIDKKLHSTGKLHYLYYTYLRKQATNFFKEIFSQNNEKASLMKVCKSSFVPGIFNQENVCSVVNSVNNVLINYRKDICNLDKLSTICDNTNSNRS